MKFQIMIGILFTLLAKRKVSASELSAKYLVSVRTIYRYVDEMTIAGIPIDVARGSTGGIYISDAFKLPKGFMTKEEYRKAIEAMSAMNSELHDLTLDSAIQKISAQVKSEKLDLTLSGNILVDSGTWGDNRNFSEKVTLIERAIEECEALDIDYCSRSGAETRRQIHPHLLVYKQNIWYVFAYCTTREAFRLFKLGRIRAVLRTGKIFERRPFRKEDVPLQFWHESEKSVFARFEISQKALPFAEEWLGIENVQKSNDKFYSEALLPDDESLVGKILSLGEGFKVLEPESLKERVKAAAGTILRQYEE